MVLMKLQSLVTLGRQPALGIAELESLYGGQNVQPFGDAALLALPANDIAFWRLGGSTRLCKLLTELPSPHWGDIKNYLLKSTLEHAVYVPEGKLTIGLSVFGVKVVLKDVERTLLEIKKRLRATGRPIRIVPNKQLELNTAQILHNKLTGPQGWELVVVSDGQTAYLAQTVQIQDIEAYAARDQARPFRDAYVGMLPPKLAQIIINLAVGEDQPEVAETTNAVHLKNTVNTLSDVNPINAVNPILDPFCGTGVVLQEGTLMGFDVYGTDIEPRMVQYSIDNLHWIREKSTQNNANNVGEYVRIEQADATTHKWQQPIRAVAGETYLGKPLASLPASDLLSKIIYEANLVNHKFLQNIAPQLASGTRLCMAMPAWRGKHEFLHLPALDHLQELGYTRLKFTHASTSSLVYHREGQVVARELVVLVKE